MLIVDDEPSFRSVLEMVLEDEGYTTSQARDGRAALDLAAALRPDVIVLDLVLPVLDGFGFIAAYRQRCPEPQPLPIVAMSASLPRPGVRERLEALGVRAFLAKPFELDTFLTCVRGLLDPRADAGAPPGADDPPTTASG